MNRWLPPAWGPDLDAILARALAKAPERRYASTERLADDLRRYLAHRPGRAQVPWAGQARLLLRRNRGLAWTGRSPRWRWLLAMGALTPAADAGCARLVSGRRGARLPLQSRGRRRAHRGQKTVLASDLIATAVERARREFAEQPRLRGELLGS